MTKIGHMARLAAEQAGSALPLLALLLVTVVLVSPAGDFPLNDDWLYAKQVQHLLDTHEFRPHPYVAAMTFAQTIWGALFAGAFGFSFTALRASTLVLALVAAWAAVGAGRSLGLPRLVAFMCGALILTNPLFLNLSYTFMTDVPFMATATLSALFFLKALRDGKLHDVFLGSLFSALSFFVRQFGLLTAAAFVLTVVIFWRVHTSLRTRRAVAAFVGPWVLAGVLFVVLQRAGYGQNATKHVFSNSTTSALNHFAIALTYLGFFLIPVACGRAYLIVSGKTPWSRRRVVVFVIAAVVLWVVMRHPPMFRKLPDQGNLLRDLGVGPLLFRHTWPARFDWSLATMRIGAWWYALTALGVGSAALLITDAVSGVRDAVVRRLRDKSAPVDVQTSLQLFLLIWAALLVVILHNPLLPVVFDRYFVPALVPLTLLFSVGLVPRAAHPFRTGSRAVLCLSVAAPLVLMYLFGLFSLHDYMAVNRARWSALDHLIKDKGVSVRDIDGGYEFNGMYTSDIFMKENQSNDFLVQGELGWWVLKDTYAVTPWPRENFEKVAEFPYYCWLGMKTRQILVLHRVAPDSLGP